MVCLTIARNFSAPFGGISVDFAYMDQIVQFNQEDMDVVVQPSIGWQDLNEQLNKMGSGLFFPVDPGKSLLRPPTWFAQLKTTPNKLCLVTQCHATSHKD